MRSDVFQAAFLTPAGLGRLDDSFNVFSIPFFLDSTDEEFKTRALIIKEERAELVKHHLWVLWTDYFKPEHVEKFPNLHDLFWRATKAAGEAKHSGSLDHAQALLDRIDEIGAVFAQTKPGYDYEAVVKNTNLQIGL